MDKSQLKTIIARAESLCRQRGARLTPQRRAVLRLLCLADKPLTAYELLDRMRAIGDRPAPPTVFRALDFLLEQGLAHKLESLHAFIGCAHPEHPHAGQFLICNDCGEVSEMEHQTIADGLKSMEQAIGFRTSHPVVELLGTCAECLKKSGQQR